MTRSSPTTATLSRRALRRRQRHSPACSPARSSLSLAGAGGLAGNRFVLVVLRGGMDGLGAVPALGDPDFAAARGPLAQYALAAARTRCDVRTPSPARRAAGYVRSGEAAVVHAVGLAYRERSHFDAQQVLESGGTRPYELTTGWLGRALAASGSKGIALNTSVPLVLRGSAAIDTWAPSTLPDPSADLVARARAHVCRRPVARGRARAGTGAPSRRAAARAASMNDGMAAPGCRRRRDRATSSSSRAAPPSS